MIWFAVSAAFGCCGAACALIHSVKIDNSLKAVRAENEQLTVALANMCYGYLRIQESSKGSAFAARAYRAARELVDIDTSKSWANE